MTQPTIRYCRICNQALTFDNIYPNNIKKHDWICKACDNACREDRRSKQHVKESFNDPVLNAKMLDALDNGVVVKRVTTSNHVKPQCTTPMLCPNCKAYDTTCNVCRAHPPLLNGFPHVSHTDYCHEFIPRVIERSQL